MRPVKNFEEYLKEGIIKKVVKNKERSHSLKKEAQRRLRSLNERIHKLGVTNDNANDYVEYCYDILMPLIRSKLCTEGYAAQGQGAHEAEVSYLRTLGFAEQEVQFADQLRYFRNGILYYGTSLDAEYAQKVIAFTKATYPKLQ
jgi:hypothetical protein